MPTGQTFDLPEVDELRLTDCEDVNAGVVDNPVALMR
jgi:hypothetical protein